MYEKESQNTEKGFFLRFLLTGLPHTPNKNQLRPKKWILSSGDRLSSRHMKGAHIFPASSNIPTQSAGFRHPKYSIVDICSVSGINT